MIVLYTVNNLRKVAQEVNLQFTPKICPAKFRLDGQQLDFKCNKQQTHTTKQAISMLSQIVAVKILLLDVTNKS
jgi:hypothetical protein